MYTSNGNQVLYDNMVVAICDEAGKAADLINKSDRLNDSRKYTASARMMYQAQRLPGFHWTELAFASESITYNEANSSVSGDNY